MDLCDLAPPYIRAIAPYQPGKPLSELERELGIRDAVKLASNENPSGASPKAVKAIRAALKEIARYPDGNGFELKAALAKHTGVAQDAIVLGNGSNDVLELVARAYLAPGLNAVFSQYCFAVYPLAAQATGAACICAPAKDFGHDLDAMLAAVTPATRVIFIANPNNPTGTLVLPAHLEKFLQKLPGSVIVVLDEAYREYLPANLQAASIAWLKKYPNLVVTRTFSKIYGLAGLRVGYAVAHPMVADLMNRVRQPFNVSSLAQAAARAALSDRAFVRKSFMLNQAGMKTVTAALKKLNIAAIPSFANFVSFRLAEAGAVYERLLKRGVIVRPLASYAMPDFLRVSIGLTHENARFLKALKQSLA